MRASPALSVAAIAAVAVLPSATQATTMELSEKQAKEILTEQFIHEEHQEKKKEFLLKLQQKDSSSAGVRHLAEADNGVAVQKDTEAA